MHFGFNIGQHPEATYSPWSYCLEELHHIIRLLRLEHKECARMGASFIARNITGPAVSNMAHALNYDQGMLNGDMIYYSGLFGDQDVINAGKRAFLDSQVLDVDVRKGYYRAAVAHGGEEFYDKVMSLYLSEAEVHEKRRLMYALGSALKPALITRTLNLALSNDVKRQVRYLCGFPCF